MLGFFPFNSNYSEFLLINNFGEKREEVSNHTSLERAHLLDHHSKEKTLQRRLSALETVRKVALSIIVVCGVAFIAGLMVASVGVSLLGVGAFSVMLSEFFLETVVAGIAGIIFLLLAGVTFCGTTLCESKWKGSLRELVVKQEKAEVPPEEDQIMLSMESIEGQKVVSDLSSREEAEVCIPDLPDLKVAEEPSSKLEDLKQEEDSLATSFSYLKHAACWDGVEEKERPFCSNPLSIAKAIARDQKVWLSLVKTESFYIRDVSKAVSHRCVREMAYVFLGFLSLSDLQDINAMEGSMMGRGDEEYNKLYAKCIKKYPQLVAAEVAYFMWIKAAYPYLAYASEAVFRDSKKYKREMFIRLHTFLGEFSSKKEEKVRPWLERFVGWGPACLASFQLSYGAEQSLEVYEDKWEWDLFCRKIPEFCRLSMLRKDACGEWTCFIEFMRKGNQSSWLTQEEFAFEIAKEEDNFFDAARPLWNMQELVDKDAELGAKIEEGLSLLSESGYLGDWSVEEMQDFERTLLGLRKKSH